MEGCEEGAVVASEVAVDREAERESEREAEREAETEADEVEEVDADLAEDEGSERCFAFLVEGSSEGIEARSSSTFRFSPAAALALATLSSCVSAISSASSSSSSIVARPSTSFSFLTSITPVPSTPAYRSSSFRARMFPLTHRSQTSMSKSSEPSGDSPVSE